MLHLQRNLIFSAYSATLPGVDRLFQSSTNAPDVYLPSRVGLVPGCLLSYLPVALCHLSGLMKWKSRACWLTGCRCRGERGELKTADDPCLSADVTLLFGVFCSCKTLSTTRLNRCCVLFRNDTCPTLCVCCTSVTLYLLNKLKPPAKGCLRALCDLSDGQSWKKRTIDLFPLQIYPQ